MTQSHAIARYGAKLQPISGVMPAHYVADLYPTNAVSAMIVDEAIAIVDQVSYSPTHTYTHTYTHTHKHTPTRTHTHTHTYIPAHYVADLYPTNAVFVIIVDEAIAII